jgi:hypothetical protein
LLKDFERLSKQEARDSRATDEELEQDTRRATELP